MRMQTVGYSWVHLPRMVSFFHPLLVKEVILRSSWYGGVICQGTDSFSSLVTTDTGNIILFNIDFAPNAICLHLKWPKPYDTDIKWCLITQLKRCFQKTFSCKGMFSMFCSILVDVGTVFTWSRNELLIILDRSHQAQLKAASDSASLMASQGTALVEQDNGSKCNRMWSVFETLPSGKVNLH